MIIRFWKGFGFHLSHKPNPQAQAHVHSLKQLWAPSTPPTWAWCSNLNPNPIHHGQAQDFISFAYLGLVPQLKPKSISIMGKPKTSSPSQLASPPGYHLQRKLPPPAAPWREEQRWQSGGIQKMLPPRWLVQVPAWSERMMVSGEVSKRLADAMHAAKKKWGVGRLACVDPMRVGGWLWGFLWRWAKHEYG